LKPPGPETTDLTPTISGRPGGGTPTRAWSRSESHLDVVDLLIKAARRGEWRVVGLMLDRVFGRATEHIVTEPPKPRWQQEMDELSLE
jgi:hypothetical protein